MKELSLQLQVCLSLRIHNRLKIAIAQPIVFTTVLDSHTSALAWVREQLIVEEQRVNLARPFLARQD